MASLDDQFVLACDHFAVIAQGYSKRQQLKMFALYNQATGGDIDAPEPSKMSFKAWHKWNARTQLKGMSDVIAKKRYIAELRNIDPNWDGGSDNPTPLEASGFNFTSTGASAKNVTTKPHPIRPASSSASGQFQAACSYASQSGLFRDNVQRVILYGYYKQATVGPCSVPAPFLGNRTKYASWRAWANLYDMPADIAMAKYVDQVTKIAPDFMESISDDEAEVEPVKTSSLVQERLSRDIGEVAKEGIDAAKAKGGMVYLVTGGTGFIGKNLLNALMKREGSCILVLTREASRFRLLEFAERTYGDEQLRIIPVVGNLTQVNLGMNDALIATLKGNVDHFFHLAASYNMRASEEENNAANVDGTRNAVDLCNNLGAAMQYTSSIVVAGDHNGLFFEDSYDLGQDFKNPYAKTKYIAEGIVWKECKVPFRIYRPGVVVGHSLTGEMDKIDGPYFFFKPLQKLRRFVPSWVTLPCIEGGAMPLVPVDYVANAMDALAHKPGLDSKAFHLVDSSPNTLVEMLNILSQAAHGPSFSSRLAILVRSFIPRSVISNAEEIPILKQLPGYIAKNTFGIPESATDYLLQNTDWDDTETRDALRGSGIACPSFKSYAWRLWDYYERHMDRSLDHGKALKGEIGGKVIVVTGASDGIGKALSTRLAVAGAKVVLVARNQDKLEAVKKEIEEKGGEVYYYTADLSQEESTNAMVKAILKDFGAIDFLVNNAGRSIRRSVEYQYTDSGRFHDFERCIALNYYGSLRCILGFLPTMRERKEGQIINVSSIGAVTNAPRFGAYIGSKGALDAFSRCISGEIATDNIHISTVYMPLVATKMVVSTGNKYEYSMLTTDEASALIERAMVTKERRVATDTGMMMAALYAVFPSLAESVLNFTYRLEPERAPTGQENTDTASGDTQQLKALAMLLKGAV